MSVFKLPDLGEGLQEAELVTWHVEPGERVVADQPLVSVETDKAVVEVPAPHAGTVTVLHAEVGEVVPVGAPLVEFDTDEKREDSGVIVGKLSEDAARIEDDGRITRPQTAPSGPSGVRAAPAVRAHAKALGIDIEAVSGTGPDGAVMVADLVAFQGGAVPAAPEKTVELPSAPGFEGGEKLSGVRRSMARGMEMSRDQVVPANVMDEVDIDHWPDGEDVTFRLIRAIGAACVAEPALNAWYDRASDSRLLHERVDLGVAVHSDQGLFVPVFRDVAKRDAEDIRDGLRRMKEDVDNRAIPPDELRGATITLSNYGVFRAGRHSEMIVLPPQVAIVGAGRIEQRVVAVDGAPAVHRVLPLSLTFDHRPVNGGEAAGFLRAMMADLSL